MAAVAISAAVVAAAVGRAAVVVGRAAADHPGADSEEVLQAVEARQAVGRGW